MAFLKLTFRPGINRDQTDYSGEGGWWDGDRIRFRLGQPKNLGGWAKATLFTFIGVCRQLHNWVTTFQDNLMAIGTNVKLYIEFGGNVHDITPLREDTPLISPPNTDNSITTLAGSNVVTMTLAVPHGADTGSYVHISGVVGPIGGIPASDFNVDHKITDTGANTFTFETQTVATSTAGPAGGVAIFVSFDIAPGYPIATFGYGWGTGTWGRGTWGSGAMNPIILPQRDWWYDNIDNDLVANIRNGPIYYWTRGTNLTPPDDRAVLLSSLAAADGYDPDAVPVKVMQIALSQQDRHLLAFGAVPFGSTDPADFDPLLIRWADQDNWTEWTPTALNSAGFIRISRGSKIVRALPTRQEFLIWTDERLYALQFLGTTDVFGLQEYSENLSIISPRAVITAANVTYWMGQDKFYAYTGRVETLPCTLRNPVFSRINRGQLEQVVCGTNEDWNEVWWFYPADGALYNNRYVVYNYEEQAWYYGNMERTAWLDTPLRRYPQAIKPVAPDPTDPVCFLMNHEYGTDDEDLPMNSFIESNDFDLGDGDQFMLTKRLIPDVAFNGSLTENPSVRMQIRPRNFPGSNPFPDAADTQVVTGTASGDVSVSTHTQQVFYRARSRQMAFRVMCDQIGVNWQLGIQRLDVRPDGRR